ncbi:MAG TPA: YfiR family protein, partial [Candidatus Acidoferrales bacterium]|nr:YfiR family protein [Candidatus Acidoferrales bacterium]
MPRTLVAVLAVLASAYAPVQSQSRADEYRVKAAFIFHFAELAEWPPEVMNSADSAFKVCVIGEDPFHGALEESMQGKSMGARPIRVRYPKEFREALACQVLFVAETESKRVSALLNETKDAPVLTIGDSEDFVLQNGGMIGF